MSRRALLSGLLLFVACSLAATAEEEPAVEVYTRLALPHPIPPETDWYGIYQGRDKVGWAMLQLTLEGEGEAARYVSRTLIEATLRGMGQRMAFSLEATDVFRGSPPWELLTSRETRKEGDVVTTIALERGGDGTYAVRRKENQDAQVLRFDDLDYTLEDRLCHVHWARSIPTKGDRILVKEFEITKLQHDAYGYEVRDARDRGARGLTIRVFDIRMHSKRLGALGNALMDTEGRMLKSPLAGVAEMRLEPEAQAKEERYASDLLAFGRVPTTETLGDPRTVRVLSLAVYGRGRGRLRPGPRQAVRTTPDGDTLLFLGADVGPGAAPTDEETRAARETTKAYPCDREDVRTLARRASEGEATPWEKASALVRFVSEHVEDVNLPAEYPVERLMVEPKGDSTEHARLFVTLARALDIPAREVRGLVYLGDEETAFGGHAWCEVAIDGRWIPVDPTWNQTEPDATHVAVERGSDAWVEMLALTRALTFEVRSVEHGR